jgi:hypothetical protein
MFNQKPLLIHKMLIWLFPVFALVNFFLSGPSTNTILLVVYALGIIFFSSRDWYRHGEINKRAYGM